MKYELTQPYGGDTTFTFWLAIEKSKPKSYSMQYGEEFQVTLSCHFNLAKYPFDSHECQLYFGDQRYNSSELKFNPINIHYNMNRNSEEVDPIIIDNSPLPFKFQLKPLAVKEKDVIGYHNVSFTGMHIKIKRKSLGQLLSGYYYPTTSFALFSMVSFIINPDVVSLMSEFVKFLHT